MGREDFSWKGVGNISLLTDPLNLAPRFGGKEREKGSTVRNGGRCCGEENGSEACGERYEWGRGEGKKELNRV